MAEYQVAIIPPSAHRMAGNRKIVITLYSGWLGVGAVEYDLEIGATTFDFEVPDDYEWIYATTCKDGPTFIVEVKYKNSTGSREEVYSLVPQKITGLESDHVHSE